MEQSDNFTGFPKLPIEMRHKVWVLSFEGKEVGVDVYPLWEEEHPGSDPHWSKQPPRVFPVSLWVNKESRTETLRHYRIISLGDVFDKYKNIPSICVNFSIDTFVMSKVLAVNSGRRYNGEDMNNTWLVHLDSIGNNGLQRVQSLEIRNFHWGHLSRDLDVLARYRYEVQHEQLRPGERAGPLLLPLLKTIQRFTGLKVLCLTWQIICPVMAERDGAKTLEDCRTRMQAFVDRHKEIFAGDKAPEVKMRCWNKKANCYVYSVPNTEEVVGKQ
ncbi:hypothetical protein N431DRAFT_442072 [Stipitochalara longipes BDJ]|nr:hypothetical protein N431DRAFT_442072 [Stipitochalara longipes BDJ]